VLDSWGVYLLRSGAIPDAVRALSRAARYAPLEAEIAVHLADATLANHAPKVAAELLEGSMYERYYGVSYARVRRMDVERQGRHGPALATSFAELCQELAGTFQPLAGSEPIATWWSSTKRTHSLGADLALTKWFSN